MWQPGWEGDLGRVDTCMTESFHCSLETITISYTPMKNIFGFKNYKNKTYIKHWEGESKNLGL